MRTLSLDRGLETITYQRVGEEVHLPADRTNARLILPRSRELDEILNRPSLDERLANFLPLSQFVQELLLPGVLSSTRDTAQAVISEAAQRASPQDKAFLATVAAMLAQEKDYDIEIQSCLIDFRRG